MYECRREQRQASPDQEGKGRCQSSLEGICHIVDVNAQLVSSMRSDRIKGGELFGNLNQWKLLVKGQRCR